MRQPKIRHTVDNTRQMVSAAAMQVLLLLPLDGSWSTLSGTHARVVSAMLDEGTSLFEEEVAEDGEEIKWRVRLTENGKQIAQRL